MTILLRKIKCEAVALIRQTGGLFRLSAPRHPSLLATAGYVAVLIFLPLLLLTIAAAALHFGGADGSVMLAVTPLIQLKADREKLVKKANDALTAIQAKAKAENRVMTAEEKAEQDAFDTQIAALDEQISSEQRKLDRERGGPAASATEPVPGSGPQRQVSLHNRAEDDKRSRGFRSHREYLTAVAEAEGLRIVADVPDERLRPLAVVDKEDKKSKGELAFMLPEAYTPRSILAAAGSDEHGTYTDTYGGVAVGGPARIAGVLQTGFEGDPTAGRTMAIPMEKPSVEIMARTDKDHTTSVSGGFVVGRKAETVAASASRGGLEMITLKAASLFGFGYATEELLTDSPSSFIAIIDNGFREEFPATVLNEKIRGLGGNEFLGVLNSPALVTQDAENNQAADTIVGRNIIKMASRIWGDFIWMANHDCKPQLYELQIPVGTAGALLYQPSKQEGFPDMMLGRPIFYNEFCSKLGDVGDVMGVNWSQFLEGLYQPLQSAESIHVRFDRHERAFKFWLRNAGAPWWRAPLTPKKSTVTLSPIVTLAAR